MSRRPNILIMMCDQLTAGALGCYGGPLPTPNLDRLAAGGVLFTDAICTTPYCSPSRASLINGLYPHTHGINYNCNRIDYPAIQTPATEEGIKASDVTTERLLSEAGWDTHHYGKWHLSDEPLPYYTDMYGEHLLYEEELSHVFEGVRKEPRETWMDWYNWALPVTRSQAILEAEHNLAGAWDSLVYKDFLLKAGRLELPQEQVFDIRVAEKTIERLHHAGDVPFMLTCSFNMPHDPNVTPSPWYDSVDPGSLPLPENWDLREERFEPELSRHIVADLGEAAAREYLRIYYAAVLLVDDQVGRILKALEDLDLAENTLVLFTADHGDFAGGHGMFWKSSSAFYEELVHIPMIMRLPGVLEPNNYPGLASLVDVMPTLLEFAGQPIPEGLQGQSLVPWLTGAARSQTAPDLVFCERVQPTSGLTRQVGPDQAGSFMARSLEWKYILYPGGDEYLYNLEYDRAETTNLADSEPARKTELRAALEEWLTRTGWSGKPLPAAI